MQDRTNVVILGRLIGTASGWDQSSDFGITFYDFESEVLPETLPKAPAVFVDLETGLIEAFDDTELLFRYDAPDLLRLLPRVKPANEKRLV